MNPNVVVSAYAGQRAKTAQERSILFWSNSAERTQRAETDQELSENLEVKTKEAEKEASKQRDQSPSPTSQSPTSNSPSVPALGKATPTLLPKSKPRPGPATPKFESCDDCQRIFLSSQVRYFLSWIYYHD